MSNESKTQFKVGETYKTRGGKERKILYIAPPELKSEYPILAISLVSNSTGKEMIPNVYSLKGEVSRNSISLNDLLPPAPPKPERRTVWLNVYASGFASVHPHNYDANQILQPSKRQGDPVPVNLERQPDDNWKVVAELTLKQKAADAMYEALEHVLLAGEYFNREIIKKALAKAEGRE